ncbi:2-C-methyl-D-erythritol 4-phosphate cytidylyltransferase [Herminiimonas sp. CN]|uniref:2-C-methyl-D-erythritol 4-phosphate cytidylyltransferase n=1 Tax=Herminiimonas sp. CN TaxID=1349818 RepID=UPI00047360A1|nr:2-C-methyl-D-erythritol 4-phosphate cytidylyltransferase [Herminiimonas sp. CN]
MNPLRHYALIPAAGVGARMGAECPKQYLPLAGQPMLRHAVAAFLHSPLIAHTFVVVSPDDAYIDQVLGDLAGVTVLRCGGATRRDSVLNGLLALRDRLAADDWVLVHDAARPGLTPALIAKLVEAIGDSAVGGLLALPVVDTVKRMEAGRVQTVPRDGLWLAQTPQMFRYALLERALRTAAQVTDEASAIEAVGLTPLLVAGHACNLKVTQPADMALAELFMATGRDIY